MSIQLNCPICLKSLFEPTTSGQDGVEHDVQLNTDGTASSSQISPEIPIIDGILQAVLEVARRSDRTTEVTNSEVYQSQKAQSEFDNGTSATQCGHLFHTLCLQNWSKQVIGKSTCPTCYKKFSINKIIQVFMDAGIPEPSTDNTAGTTPSPSTTTIGDGDRQFVDINPASYTGCNLQDLKNIHDTLLSDFTGLKNKYRQLEAENNVRGDDIKRLEDTNGQLQEKLNKYEAGESHPSTLTPTSPQE